MEEVSQFFVILFYSACIPEKGSVIAFVYPTMLRVPSSVRLIILQPQSLMDFLDVAIFKCKTKSYFLKNTKTNTLWIQFDSR